MKKLFLFVTMAASLLFTQCKKEESVSSAGKTVRMTVTAGPGSKTDITDAGAITWSTGDKLYVGDGEKYIGYLTLVGEGGSATGVFTGNVTLTDDAEFDSEEEEVEEEELGKGDGQTFHFFYLGSNPPEVASSAPSVDVEFDNQTGLLGDLGSCHVGYGSATGTVVDNVVTNINVMLVSKVALAHFSFTDGTDPYTGALTLSGDNICNKMTVNFASEGFACEGTKGEISLTDATSSEKYVMLVPTNSTTTSQTLTFADANVSGTATLKDGIKPNQFYGKDTPIAVTVKEPVFTVGMDGTTPRTVEFAPGNLYYDGSAFRFEANQWDFRNYSGLTNDAAFINNGAIRITPSGTVGSFFWSKDAAKACANVYDGTGAANTDVFFTNATETTANTDFHVNGETGENKWRTLSKAEWDYLLNTRTNASSLRAWKDLGNGVKGLVILPDGTDASVMESISSTADLASSGAVFLPVAGDRDNDGIVWNVGSYGSYWSSTCIDSNNAYYMFFNESSDQRSNGRNHGFSVRLVR